MSVVHAENQTFYLQIIPVLITNLFRLFLFDLYKYSGMYRIIIVLHLVILFSKEPRDESRKPFPL